MLFIKEPDGTYRTAPVELVLMEANNICDEQLQPGGFIEKSCDAALAIKHKLINEQNEVFICLFMDNRHRILAFKEICQGTINANRIYPRVVVKEALQLNAASVIFAHNHPSGSTTISNNDIELTITLRDILKVIDVRVLDHLVVGDEIVSFADLGMMDNLENQLGR